jgi:hypothetical protein
VAGTIPGLSWGTGDPSPEEGLKDLSVEWPGLLLRQCKKVSAKWWPVSHPRAIYYIYHLWWGPTFRDPFGLRSCQRLIKLQPEKWNVSTIAPMVASLILAEGASSGSTNGCVLGWGSGTSMASFSPCASPAKFKGQGLKAPPAVQVLVIFSAWMLMLMLKTGWTQQNHIYFMNTRTYHNISIYIFYISRLMS